MTNGTVTSDGRRYLRDIEGPLTDHGPSDGKELLVCARGGVDGSASVAITSTGDAATVSGMRRTGRGIVQKVQRKRPPKVLAQPPDERFVKSR
jgi:hypothetical protein